MGKYWPPIGSLGRALALCDEVNSYAKRLEAENARLRAALADALEGLRQVIWDEENGAPAQRRFDTVAYAKRVEAALGEER